ncbi:mediator of RNA polymerase II transcription subunit 20-like isoform X2 [Temnothorax americanus]
MASRRDVAVVSNHARVNSGRDKPTSVSPAGPARLLRSPGSVFRLAEVVTFSSTGVRQRRGSQDGCHCVSSNMRVSLKIRVIPYRAIGRARERDACVASRRETRRGYVARVPGGDRRRPSPILRYGERLICVCYRCRLQQYPMIENRTGPQTIEFLTKRVVALGAVQVGQFLVDCETYMSVPQLGVQRTVHVLHNSEQPASVFALLESGSKVVPLIADGLFDLLMLKMTNIYTSKKQTKIESKGPRFEIGDFCVKLGSVTMSQNFKGVLVEVEYRPCVVAASAWELIREFLQGFLGSAVSNQAPQYLQNRMNEIYQPMDTIQQYLEHFGQYRKATGVI